MSAEAQCHLEEGATSARCSTPGEGERGGGTEGGGREGEGVSHHNPMQNVSNKSLIGGEKNLPIVL